MKVISAQNIRELERIAIEERGIPSPELMEQASKAAAEHILTHFAPAKPRTVVLCGHGKNGGDGFACARLLRDAGCSVEVVFLGDSEKLAPDTKANRERWKGSERTDPESAMHNPDCIVDALFGIGFHGTLAEPYASAVYWAAHSLAYKVAIDLPSGVETDTGAVHGEAFPADCSVTFTYPKPACGLLPGSVYCGEVIPADIGLPQDLLKSAVAEFQMLTPAEAAAWLPKRYPTAHKGDFGRAVCIGGSGSYPGAICMAAAAALRCGAGLVTAAVPQPVWPIAAMKLTEAMPRACAADEKGRFSADALPQLLELQKNAGAVLLGPGLDREGDLTELVETVMREGTCPLVLDADGIYAYAAHKLPLQGTRAVILTPHDGEMARLLGEFPPKEGRERLECARKYARETGCILVLKGHRTVIAAPDGEAWINTTGNAGMAKGGSGDVLAGMLCALLAQGMTPIQAAVLAVWLHGRAGDVCARKLGQTAMLPTDCIAALPEVLQVLEG